MSEIGAYGGNIKATFSGTIPVTVTQVGSNWWNTEQNVTASAVALPSQTLAFGFTIATPSGNAGAVYYGEAGVTTATGTALLPGSVSPKIPVNNADLIYIIGTLNDKVLLEGN